MSGSLFVSVLVLSLSVSTAWAQGFVVHASDYEPDDVDPPRITHEPITYTARGADLVVSATITDASGVFGPTVSYRHADSADKWSIVDMRAVDGEPDVFKAVIGGSQVTGNIEYFVESYDTNGNGPTKVGSAESPLKVLAIAPPPGSTPAVERPFPVAPVALAGAGVVTTVVGAALWFTAKSRIDEIDAKYTTPGQGRLANDADATRSAVTRSRVGSGLMIAGGAAIAGGVVWFLLPGSDGAEVGVAGTF